MASSEQVAWVAGIIEGEGTFSINADHSIRMIVRMTDEDVLLRAYALFGGSFSGPYQEKNRAKPIWTWSMGRREQIVPFLKSILPYMGGRRTFRINQLLEHAEAYPKGRQRKNAARHGTITMYTYGCRCDQCVSAGKAYWRTKYAERKSGK